MTQTSHWIYWTAILVFLISANLTPTEADENPLALKAARMLDVESGEMLEDVTVLVTGETIKAVNPDRLPPGTEVLDLGDRTLLPGLMDLHTHLLYSMEGDWIHRSVKESPADAALRGVGNAAVTLKAGFTTVRDVGGPGFADISLARAIERGAIDGPRMFPAGHSLGITGGHCDTTGYAPGIAEGGPKQGIADGAAEVLKAVRYQIKHGAKVIKICATAGVLSFEESVGAQQFSEEELRAVVEEARRHGLKVAAHAHGSEGILAAVKAGVASIEHGSTLTDEIIEEMKRRGTFLVPTSYLGDALDLSSLPAPLRAKAEFVIPLAKASLSRAIRAGVNIAFGTDAAVYPHGLNAREFSALVARGMTPLEAIRSATTHAAELIGIEDRGSIRAGLLADLIAVEGNPLKDVSTLESVSFVMKGGKIYHRPQS